MTIGLWAMLIGIFGVPLMLLWTGHRLRRRPPRWRAAFWGGLVGHLVAIVVGSVAAMTPPEMWAPSDVWRGAFGFWSFVLLPLLGAAIAVVMAPRAT